MSDEALTADPVTTGGRRLTFDERRAALALVTRPLTRFFTPDVLRGLRWAASLCWVFFFAATVYADGVSFDREGLLLWIATGVTASSIGRRALWTVIVDWLPFALVLIVYDYLRGISDTLGMPTWWTPQIDVDRFLGFGHEPTVWLQEHLKYPGVQWWDVLVCLCYVSFFILPYATAGVLWLRSRADFRRWAGRFVSLSFLGFGLFALIPAAPPWAAARCTAADVASHPSGPACMGFRPRLDGGLLGALTSPRPGANPWIERISGRGWSELHLGIARSVLDKGQATVNLVAAVPSLHAGGTLLFVLFMWRRVRIWWKAVLAFYVPFMAFTLIYSAEHYLADILAGWLAAIGIHLLWGWIERRRSGRRTPDTLDAAPEATAPMEISCPPTVMTPSSTSASAGDSSSPPARSTVAPGPPGTTGRSASS